MEAFREARLRRARRQAVTLARAIRAARARTKAKAPRPPIDGGALRHLLAEVAADARLVHVPVNRPPWTAAGIHVAAGERVTWLAWGAAYAARRLGIGFGPSIVLIGRVGHGPAQNSARDTCTFTADREGPVELGSSFPGDPRADGSFVTDRVPYRAMSGRLQAVVVRWAPGTDPGEVLSSVASRDASGLCAAEAARLADQPQPPPVWHHHPVIGEKEVYAPSEAGITACCRSTVGIIRKPADAPLTPTLRLRWSWRLDELPSRLPEDTALTHDYLSVALEFDDGQTSPGIGAPRFHPASPTAARSSIGATARRTSSRAAVWRISAAGSRRSGLSSPTIRWPSAGRHRRVSSGRGSSRSAAFRGARGAGSSGASTWSTETTSSACSERRSRPANNAGRVTIRLLCDSLVGRRRAW